MSVELVRGGNAPLDEAELLIRLSWSSRADADVSALLVTASGRVRSDDDFVFYNQPTHASGAVAHRGGRQDERQSWDSLSISSGRVQHDIDRVVIVASAGGAPLGQVPGLRVEIVGAESGAPLVAFTPSAASETAFVVGEVYRRTGQWKFRAVGRGYESGLAGLARDFGISVDDEGEQAPTPGEPPALAPVTYPGSPPVAVAPSTPLVAAPPVPVEMPAPVALVPQPQPVTAPMPAPLPAPLAPVPASGEEDDEQEVTLTAFDTPNPYLRKLFTMKEFGRAPGRALQIFRERVVDPDERMLAAFKSQHGRWRWGYLIMTTEYVRWIQTVPRQDEEMYEYTDRIEQEGSMIRLPTGDQFQLKGFGAGRKFKALFRLAQQASLWEPR